MTSLATTLPGSRRVREESGEYRQREAVPTRLNQRFAMGRVFVTPGALALLRNLATDGKPYSVQRVTDTEPLALVLPYVGRHMASDWGDVEDADVTANELALVTGERLLSAFRLPNGDRLWVITDGDRSRTTVLLPNEY